VIVGLLLVVVVVLLFVVVVCIVLNFLLFPTGLQPFSFWPKGYWLPKDFDAFEQMYKDENDEHIPYILKPSRMAMGNGIICITHVSQVKCDSKYIQDKTPVAQKYLYSLL